jgi:Ser/Thr protein kinase RdoA (MazF antagonist)
MSHLVLASQFIETVYQRQIAQIEALPPLFSWRGLYRVHDTQGSVWILRLLHVPSVVEILTRTADMLQWLEQHHYPAPRLVLTHHHQMVGFLNGWGSLLLSYVDGTVLDVHSTDFARLGFALGQLHMMPLANADRFPLSRCDPALLRTKTARQLATDNERVAPSFQPLLRALRDSLNIVTSQNDTLCLTHGDCWYKNAIKTRDGTVVLIDWDCGGVGLPILDVGYLLLTAHYDFTRPFQVTADAQKILAILHGYQRARRITKTERVQMQSAIQFILAFQVGEHVAGQPFIASDDVFLQKAQTRLAASIEIAQIAQQAIV